MVALVKAVLTSAGISCDDLFRASTVDFDERIHHFPLQQGGNAHERRQTELQMQQKSFAYPMESGLKTSLMVRSSSQVLVLTPTSQVRQPVGESGRM